MVRPWDTALIGDFLDFKNGLNKGKEFFGHGTPIINYTDVYKKRELKKTDIHGRVSLPTDEIHRFDVRKNDVFFTRTSETPDEVGIASVLLEHIDDCVFSGFVLRGRPKNDMLIPEYCKYCFSTEAIRNAIVTGCTYTTRALTNGKQLSAIEIAVPPKPEQEAIAAALSDIDVLIDNLEKLIAKKKAIKQACLQDMFPKPGETVPKMRLPGFTGAWEQRKLGEVVEIVGGNAWKSTDYRDDGEYLVVTIANVTGERYIDDTVGNHIHAGTENPNILERGDILVSLTGNVGRVSKCTAIKAVLNQRVGKLVLKDESATDVDFLFSIVNNPIFEHSMIEAGQGAAQKNISNKDVLGYSLPIPLSIREQQAIGGFFNHLDHLITLHQRELEKYKRIKQGMMSELLTGRIRLVQR